VMVQMDKVTDAQSTLKFVTQWIMGILDVTQKETLKLRKMRRCMWRKRLSSMVGVLIDLDNIGIGVARIAHTKRDHGATGKRLKTWFRKTLMRLKAVNHRNHPNRVNQAHSLNRVARLKVEAQAVQGTLSISGISGKRTDTARTMSLLMPLLLSEILEYGHMKMVHLSLGRTGRRQL